MLGSFRAAAVTAAALWSAHVLAQNGAERVQDDLDRTPQDCIIGSRIDRTEVIDDNTIIFHMRGRGQAYVNYLPERCPNLGREERFAYERRTAQLCDDTLITVIELTGFGPGFTCRLGQFVPATEAEIEEIRLVSERAGRDRGVDVEEVELPDEADEEAEREDGEGRRRRRRN